MYKQRNMYFTYEAIIMWSTRDNKNTHDTRRKYPTQLENNKIREINIEVLSSYNLEIGKIIWKVCTNLKSPRTSYTGNDIWMIYLENEEQKSLHDILKIVKGNPKQRYGEIITDKVMTCKGHLKTHY